MVFSPAEPPLRVVRRWSAAIFPWLLSTTAHTGVLIALLLNLPWSPRSSGGLNSGISFEVSISASGESNGSDAEGPEIEGFDRTALAKAYADNPPAPRAAEIEGETTSGQAAHAPPLNHPLEVSLAGVQPRAGSSTLKDQAGSAGQEGGEGQQGRAGSKLSPQQSRAAGRHGSLGSGYARTGVFGAIGEGRKFVYVFDRSGSMDGHGGAPLAAAKAELIRSLQDLGRTHQFQIIFYNEQPKVFSPTGTPGRLVFGTDQNKQLAKKFVGSITAAGGTRHEEALEMALRMSPDVIFFLTDADEPRLSAGQLKHLLERNTGTIINAIEFGYGAQFDTDNFLVKLAHQNGGQHVYVDVARLPRKAKDEGGKRKDEGGRMKDENEGRRD